MTMTMTMPDRSGRFLLIGSLALNLFFVGTIVALAVRHVFAPAPQVTTERPRTAAARIDRMAAPLPSADAEKMRSAFKAREAAAEGARDEVNRAFERVQAALRAEPFDGARLRASLAAVRAARPAYEQIMQDILTDAASVMSPAGRAKLADAPSPRPNPSAR